MKNTKNKCFLRLLNLFLSVLILSFSAINYAQDTTAYANGIPVAPTGLQNLPLADGPWDYRTGEDMNIHVELVTRMEYPMSLVFMPDETLLVATREGRIFQVSNGVKREVQGGPNSVFIGESGGIGSVHGYIDIELHPDFQNNAYVYLSYTRTNVDFPVGILTFGRAKWNGKDLENFEIIFDTVSLNGSGSMVFGSDEKLYITTPDRDSQNLQSLGGKVLRLNDDGSVPSDNPFVNRHDALPEIFSYGHRYSLGMTVHPETGELWQSENGPNGGDEINIITAGEDYGWPSVSLGRSYQGPWHSGSPTHADYVIPLAYWMPSVAVSGLTFYTSDKLPKWQGNLFVGALRTGEVNGTGHLERILFNDQQEELRRESLLVDLHKRIRNVLEGPDGYLYLALEDKDGGILRIMPSP